ncbi:MAG: hypothetical protein QE164_02955 [Candidatus Nezhaarchaeota archaeon]|nr:hypothetical protein [Candidatus Nezhaarchaeota archaeon]
MSEDLVDVKLSLPKKAYKWFMMVAKRDGTSVEKVLQDALLELYSFKDELRGIKKFYGIMGPLNGLTSLGHALSYTLNLGSTLHHIVEHLLNELEGNKNFVLSNVKLVQDAPGAYKGVCFEFVARDVPDVVIDYFTLQIQHDGLYLDATSVLGFDSVKIATEALRRLKKSALKIVEMKEVKELEEKLKERGGMLNIDISKERNIVYLTFMVYACEVHVIPKLHKVSDVLKKICEEAGIERKRNH